MGKRTVTEAYIFSKCRKTFNSSFAISGIYKIENKINHKVYIGQSKNIKHRFHSHIYKCFILNYNHPLYCSIRKYGIQNFTFTIIKKTFDFYACELSKTYFDKQEERFKKFTEQGLLNFGD